MTADEVFLELSNFVLPDANIGELSKAGGDSVDGLAVVDDGFDNMPRLLNLLDGSWMYGNLTPFERNFVDVFDCEVFAVYEERGHFCDFNKSTYFSGSDRGFPSSPMTTWIVLPSAIT